MNQIIENKPLLKQSNNNMQSGKYIKINQNSQASCKSTNNQSLSTKSSFKTDSSENIRYIKSARRKIGLSKDQVNSLEFDFQNNQISKLVKPEGKSKKIVHVNIKSNNKSNSNSKTVTNLKNIKQHVNDESSNILNKLTNIEECYESPHPVTKNTHKGVFIGSQEYNKSTTSLRDVKHYCDSIIAEEEDQDIISNSNIFSNNYSKSQEFRSEHEYLADEFDEFRKTNEEFNHDLKYNQYKTDISSEMRKISLSKTEKSADLNRQKSNNEKIINESKEYNDS